MMTCTTCSVALSRQNKSGYCKRHISAALAQDPAWREKQRAASRMSLHSNPERLEKLRAKAREIFSLPQSIEARRKHCVDRQLWKSGNAAQPKGSASRKTAGARQSATKLPWCPAHLRADYRHLVSNRFSPAEARAMIEQQHAVEMARFRREIGGPAELADSALLAAFELGSKKTAEASPLAGAPKEPFARVLYVAGKVFKVDCDDILSMSRAQHLMPARYALAMALKRAGMSFPVIARSMKRVDHTSAMHWAKQGDYRAAHDSAFAQAVDVIAAAWNGPHPDRIAA